MNKETSNPSVTYFSDTYIYGTAMVWTNMAKMHMENMEDTQQHIDSLRNVLPDIKTVHKNQVVHDPGFF